MRAGSQEFSFAGHSAHIARGLSEVKPHTSSDRSQIQKDLLTKLLYTGLVYACSKQVYGEQLFSRSLSRRTRDDDP